ncbi:hypothetical protein [Leptodesmis sichuanensis]|uniref:hypothetical protein n=1 Tax=Leptodesmis sichuanensis TaxID=2906798 RepID=UPI001F4028CE|nr:hypothetical protein [Leptodesmis sichuanensis]UIE37237.1 hypothetical protein KIK02_20100 [Leptodesmis sichuanensis A121]
MQDNQEEQDLGPAPFVLELTAALKFFLGAEVFGDLTPDNVDSSTLEFDECKAMYETLHQQNDTIQAALNSLLQGDRTHRKAAKLIATLSSNSNATALSSCSLE